MSAKKYVFTKETRKVDGVVLHRIKALRDLPPPFIVEKGQLGGWIEQESNLSHEGTCWVAEEAMVFGKAVVSENAMVNGNAIVCGEAIVKGNAQVCGMARVGDEAVVKGNATVGNDAIIRECALIKGDARIIENARIRGRAVVGGRTWVGGNAIVKDYSRIDSGDVVVVDADEYFLLLKKDEDERRIRNGN